MALRELAIALGLEVDSKQLDAAEKRLAHLAQSAQAAKGAAGAGGEVSVDTEGFGKLTGLLAIAKGALVGFLAGLSLGALKDFLGEMAHEGAHLDDLSQRFGISTDEIQKWQFAAKMSGIEAEAADTSMKKLQVTIGHAANGNEEAQKAFASLGVQVKGTDGNIRPLTDVAADIADKMAALGDEAKMAGHAVDLFGKQGGALIPLLKTGSAGVRELYKQFDDLGGGLDHEFIQAAARADDEMDRMALVTKTLKSRIAVELLPAFTRWLQHSEKNTVAMIKFSRETTGVHTGLLALAGTGLAGAGVALKYKFIPELIKAAQASEKFKAAIDFFGGGAGGLLKMAVSAGAAVLALAGLYLLFDDLYALMNGNESVIGDTLEEFGGAGASAQLVEDLHASVDLLTESLRSMKPAAAESLGVLVELLPTVVRGFVLVVKSVMAGITAIATLANMARGEYEYFTAKNDRQRNAAYNRTIEAADKGSKAIFGTNRNVTNETTGETTRQDVGGFFGISPKELAALQGRGELGAGVAGPVYQPNAPSVTQTNAITVNVDGSKDPAATAKEVVNKVSTDINQRALQDAAYAIPGAARRGST